ncbi:IS1595 family transposase [Flavobacterium sp.]|uniref:IS1595 family transposase n=1 Tax=Flavobacterium sp. TaxID=239 RepID=UPI00374C9786
MENRDKFAGMNSIKFNQYFKTEDDCIRYIADIKWEEGYTCRNCGSEKYIKGSKPHNRRCLKCKYNESPTAGTMFDKVKFSLLVAFHIIFKIATKKKGMSTLELSREFDLRQKTCWSFKWKIQEAMQSSLQHPLTGEVHVDEFWIGGPEEEKRGRSLGNKKMIVIALEVMDKGVGRAYAEIIEKANSKELGSFMKKHIDKKARIVTDEWRGYLPLKKEYPNLEQHKSEEGKNFKDIHIHIMNMKGWLRGIHHHCSKEHMQGYLNEYHYRYNRRNHLGTTFDLLLKRMVKNKPSRIKSTN